MIAEFIKAFKRAYKEIYSEKLVAKGQIKDLEKLEKRYTELVKILKRIAEDLRAVYADLPIKARQDYVQKTLDLIKTGTYSTDMVYHYESDRNYITAAIDQMKELYANRKYQQVQEQYNLTCETVKGFKELILNSENNHLTNKKKREIILNEEYNERIF